MFPTALLALVVPAAAVRSAVHPGTTTSAVTHRAAVRSGLFDMFKESEESKRAKDEAFRVQQEMLARRRNPEAMEEYMEEVEERRAERMAEGAELAEVQKMEGGDNLEEWKVHLGQCLVVCRVTAKHCCHPPPSPLLSLIHI